MKRLLSVMCVGCILSVGATSFAQGDKVQMDKKAMMKDGQMTVSGCVAAGKDMGQYMLTHAMMMGGMMDKGMMEKDMMEKDKMMKKPGMSGGDMMSYELVGGSNLKAHMGHKVEVMGTMSQMDMDRMAKMDNMAKDKMMSDTTMSAMKLNVTSVKMVSATCP